jgi:capsular polysaccharide biosynthesis protein
MTIDEAFHRVVRGHRLLIAICLVLPMAAMFYLGGKQPVLYQAVGRVEIGTTLASSQLQADALSNRVLGIVTSPGVVQRALFDGGLNVDPVQFAIDHISINRVGVSPVIDVTVTQESPVRAALIAKSLTNQLLNFANAGGRDATTGRIEVLSATILTLTNQRDSLIPKLATASPGGVYSLQAQINAIQTTMADDLRQRSDLIIAAASMESTVLLDAVGTPTVPLPSGTKQTAALAGLLGLIGGLGLAALLETLRPTLRNPKAISFAMGAPMIGHVHSRDLESPHHSAAMNPIADRMALLGLRYGSSRAMLMSVRKADQARAGEMAEALGVTRNDETSHRLQCAALNGRWREPGEHPAIVIFSPAKVRARELRPVQELLESVDWPLLGVVTYDRPGWLTRRWASHPAWLEKTT